MELTGKLNSASWIIDARWFYLPLGFFLGAIAQRESFAPVAIYQPMMLLMLIALVLNLFFFFSLRNMRLSQFINSHILALNVAQVSFDLMFFFVIILATGGGVESIAHSFYFIPIVVSMILFGFRGALVVSLAAGALIFLSVCIQYGILLNGLHLDLPKPEYSIQIALLKATILAMIYLLTGFFGAFVSRLMKGRDALLLEKIHTEEDHVRRLEELTKEFEQSAKLLVRRDLDLSAANQQLQNLDQLKSEIISVAAHQLRTPLSAIKWTLKMLINGDVGQITPDQRELLGKGFESNERMINLVNDMLSVDRLESGRVKYNFVAVQLEDLVQGMLQELMQLATKKNIKIVFARPQQLLPKLKLDPDKMHDVLQNLIDNAIKYSNPNSEVIVRLSSDGQNIQFSVKDSGIGIPKQQQSKIFERFFRAENAVKIASDGSGLGLYIAKSIIKRHGGDIWYESEEGKGSTFYFTLPLSE